MSKDINTEIYNENVLPNGRYISILKQRKPGMDFGTVLWIVLFAFLHFLVQIVSITLSTLIIGIIKNESLYSLENKPTTIDPLAMGLATIIYSLLLTLFYYLFIRHQNKKEPRYVLSRRIKILDLVYSLIAIVACLGISNIFMTYLLVIQERIPFVKEALEQYKELIDNVMIDEFPLVYFIGTVILVPICEELLFRGIIFSELKRAIPARYAIFLTALLFAIFHWQAVQSFYVFFAGFVITLCYYYSSSIKLSILLHIVYNFLGSGIIMLMGDNLVAISILTLIEWIAVPFGFLALFLLYRQHRYDPPKSSRRLVYPFKGTLGLYDDEEQLIRLTKSDKNRLASDKEYMTYKQYVDICQERQKDVVDRIHSTYKFKEATIKEDLKKEDSKFSQLNNYVHSREEKNKYKMLKKEARILFAPFRF